MALLEGRIQKLQETIPYPTGRGDLNSLIREADAANKAARSSRSETITEFQQMVEISKAYVSKYKESQDRNPAANARELAAGRNAMDTRAAQDPAQALGVAFGGFPPQPQAPPGPAGWAGGCAALAGGFGGRGLRGQGAGTGG